MLWDDFIDAITIYKEFCGGKEDPKPSITLLNKTDTCDGHDFNSLSAMDGHDHPLKN